MDTNITPETISQLKDIKANFNDRLENLEAIKGKKFATFVRIQIQMKQSLEAATSLYDNEMKARLAHTIASSIMIDATILLSDLLEINSDELKEAVKYCKDMEESLHNQLSIVEARMKQ